MDTISINLENSKTSKPHVLTFKVTNKLDLRLGEKVIALWNIVFIIHGKTNLKFQHPLGIINLNNQMDRI